MTESDHTDRGLLTRIRRWLGRRTPQRSESEPGEQVSDDSGGRPLTYPDGRIEAGMLDFIRDDEPAWVEDEIHDLWENPDDFARGETQEVPDGVDEEDYLLFRLGVAFGVDYEQEYPEGGEWNNDE